MSSNIISADLARRIQNRLLNRQAQIENFIKSLVETESPSGDEPGSRAVVQILGEAAAKIKSVNAVDRVDVPGFGQHLVIKAFPQQTSGTVMLVGHTDTVHSLGSLAERPWKSEGNKIYGPGIFDMKANCALAIEVLSALDEFEVIPQFGVTIALTCDEEVGSASGWPLLEGLTKESDTRYAFVMEPPAPGGKVKTGRKGTGMFEIKVAGIASHAGLDPDKGASAILELARQTERLHSINKSGTGITVNVGVIKGGTRSNVVAAEAEGEIDVRFATESESEEIHQLLMNLQPIDERVKVYVSGGINRPPLERTEAVVALFEKARKIAEMVDFDLGEAQVGGASDGNFLAALGIPVLDGLGIGGDGAHAAHEHIYADDIATRGTLLAGLIASV
jgi:glutamate carboxypeptidase